MIVIHPIFVGLGPDPKTPEWEFGNIEEDKKTNKAGMSKGKIIQSQNKMPTRT